MKLENIELSAAGHCKINGFANCKKKGVKIDRSHSSVIFYTPPEFFNEKLSKEYSPSFDYWSLGIIVFKMLTTKYPFKKESEIIEKNTPELTLDDSYSWKTFGKETNDFVQDLLKKNPIKRLGSVSNGKNVKEIAFFREIDWENLELSKSPYRPSLVKLKLEYFFHQFC